MPESPTPAPVAAPVESTISATQDAVNKGDFSAFQDAHVAAKQGKPLPAVAVAPAPATSEPPPVADPTPAPKPRKEREQDYINDRIRSAVDSATQELRAEVARLRGPAPAPREPDAPTPQPAPPFPSYEDYLKTHPDTEYDAYLVDRARHVIRHEQAEERRLAHEAHKHAERQQTQTRVAEQLQARLEAARANGVDVDAVLNTELPIHPSMPGAQAVGAIVARSELAVELMQYLQAHPQEAVQIAQMPPGVAASAMWKLEGRLEGRSTAGSSTTPTPASPAPPQTITAAPPPPPVLTKPAASSDPKATAIARGDFSTFQATDLAERAAKRARP